MNKGPSCLHTLSSGSKAVPLKQSATCWKWINAAIFSSLASFSPPNHS